MHDKTDKTYYGLILHAFLLIANFVMGIFSSPICMIASVIGVVLLVKVVFNTRNTSVTRLACMWAENIVLIGTLLSSFL